MRKSRFTEAQIIGMIKEQDLGCRLQGAVRLIRTSLSFSQFARTYAEQICSHSARAALRLILKLPRE